MFNDGFFPTPTSVISRLTDGLELEYKSILDPSAGKGDILEYVSNRYHYGRNNRDTPLLYLYAVEIEPELRAILTAKRFQVVGTDFLMYPGLQYFDYIIMNPPFDNGCVHLLKAWEIANGATIRCLLNAETISNPYTKGRKRLVNIVDRYGWCKELGPVFTSADRRTSVNVVLVHLEDTRTKESFRLDFEPETVGKGHFEFDGATISNELAMSNIFENYEARYNATMLAFKELLVVRSKVLYYLTPLVRGYPTPQKITGDALVEGKVSDVSYQGFLEATTRAAWDHLFSKTKLSAVTTEGVRREIEGMQKAQGTMAFTSQNMGQLFHTLFLNREHVMVSCVLEVFDELTKHYKKNRQYYEGWKTNSAYKVGKKFILPGIGSVWGSGLEYKSQQKIEDIEKALCFLDGKQFQNIQSIVVNYKQENHFGEKMKSEFFVTKLFKKRTMHFQWCDADLRDRFNILVAKERWGELPEKVKKGVYR